MVLARRLRTVSAPVGRDPCRAGAVVYHAPDRCGARRYTRTSWRSTGWPVEAIDFYDGLEEDNSKAYWHAHKAVYEAAVRAPMDGCWPSWRRSSARGASSDPNRDVRFSADKSPYKTAIAATLAEGGYVQLSAARASASATACTCMASDQLERFREAIDADSSGQALVDLVAATRAKRSRSLRTNRSRPRRAGYPKDHPRIDLLRLKGLIVWREWPVAPWLHTRKAKTRVVDLLHASRPIAGWLDEHVGPSTLEGRWG